MRREVRDGLAGEDGEALAEMFGGEMCGDELR